MPCNSLISDTIIQNIYDDSSLVRSTVVQSQCINGNIDKKTFINISDNVENMLVRPIERTYFSDKELYSSKRIGETGRVVFHEYFILKPKFQGKGVVSRIHPKELIAYRDRFDEIQLDAAWSGLVVWKKMFYKFKSKREENLIKIAIQKYLKEIKGMSNSQIASVIKSDPFNINLNYLRDPINPFSDWAHSHAKIGLAKMYKEVS